MEVRLKDKKTGKTIMSVDKALRILKKKCDREGMVKEMRKRKHYEKPSVKKYRKKTKAKYVARLISEEKRYWA